jgi:hypothetical protein
MASGVVDRDGMTDDEPDSNEQNTEDGIYDFDGHRKKPFGARLTSHR